MVFGRYFGAPYSSDDCPELGDHPEHSTDTDISHAYLATNELYRTDVKAARGEAELAVAPAEQIGDFLGLGYATFLLLSIEAWISALASALDSGQGEELLNRLALISAGAHFAGDRNMIGHVLQLEGPCHLARAMTNGHRQRSTKQ